MPTAGEAQKAGYLYFQKILEPELRRRMNNGELSDATARARWIQECILPDPALYAAAHTWSVAAAGHLSLARLADVLCLFGEYRLAGECLHNADFLYQEIPPERRAWIDADKLKFERKKNRELRPLAKRGKALSKQQSDIASRSRSPKLQHDSEETVKDLIERVACGAEHKDDTPEELWDWLYGKIDSMGADPELIEDHNAPLRSRMWFDDRNGKRRSLTFKTLRNTVYAARNKTR